MNITHIDFLALPPAWLIVLVIVPLILGISFIPYLNIIRKSNSHKNTKKMMLAASLRMTVLTIIFGLLVQPRVVEREAIATPPPLAVIVDTSASMSISDANGQSRFNWTNSFLESDIFKSLKKNYSIKLFKANKNLSTYTKALNPEPVEATSPLGLSLSRIPQEFEGQATPEILLISDGCNNSGSSLIKAGNSLKEKNIRVHSIGVGTSSSVPDLQIELVEYASQVLTGDSALIALRIKSLSQSDTNIKKALVSLRKENGEVIDQRQVMRPSKSGETLILNTSFDLPGQYSLIAEVAPVKGELNLSNNKIKFEILVLETKVRVLYIEGKPRWEYRYLKERLIRAARDIELQCWLTGADINFEQEHSRGVSALNSLPIQENELIEQYDVIILGDVKISDIGINKSSSYTFLKNLKTFVERGGGLLLIAGPEHNPYEYLDNEIGSILPVEFRPKDKPITELFQPTPADVTRPHPTTLLSTNLDENQKLWEESTPLWWLAAPHKLKNGAQSWLVDSKRKNEYGPLIIAASHNVPRGRVAFIGTDETWRWRFPGGEKYIQKFWRATLRFLAAGKLYDKRSYIKLEVDKNNLEIGEQMIIEANIIDESYQENINDNEIRVFNSEAKEVTKLSLSKEAGLYSYRGYWRPNQIGNDTIYITENNEPNAKIISKATITVERASLEMNETTLKVEELKAMSKITGGHFLTFENSIEIQEKLKGGASTIKIINEEITFLNPWPIFTIILLLLCVEWLLRKKSNLC